MCFRENNNDGSKQACKCKNITKNIFQNVNSVLYTVNNITGGLSGLRQFLANEIPLEMMKNAFYFTSKALFVLEIFKFLSWFLVHV